MAKRRGGKTPLTRASPRRLVVGLAVILMCGVGYVGTVQLERGRKAKRLPVPPEFSGQPKSVVEHLRVSYANALQDPTSATAVGELCLAYHADMFYDQAEQCYRLVALLEPAEWRWTYYRALIDGELGRGESLHDGLRQVLSKAPDFGPAWLRLGDADFKDARYDQAEEAWNHAAAASDPDRGVVQSPARTADIPLSAYASLGLARIALVRDNAEGARRLLEAVTQKVPHFGSAFRLLAESYVALGRGQDADRARYRAGRLPAYAPYADPMIEALARESRNSTFLLRQASEADLAANAGWSEYLTRRALEFDPGNPDVLAKLGRILRTLDRNDEALEIFREYNRQVPGDFQGLAQIGSCLSALGRPDEAEPFLRRALQGTDDSLTHYNLAVVLAARGQLDQAIAEYRHAVERDPSALDARNNLATTLARRGQTAMAAQELSRILELDPDNALARTNLEIIRSLKR